MCGSVVKCFICAARDGICAARDDICAARDGICAARDGVAKPIQVTDNCFERDTVFSW